MSDFDSFKYNAEADSCNESSDGTRRISVSASAPVRSPSLDMNELSPEQRHAYIQFTKGEHLFITGPGGTGKTRLVDRVEIVVFVLLFNY